MPIPLQRKNGEFDEEAVEITGQLLSANPDFYSLWNFRREIFQHFTEEKYVFPILNSK